MAEEDFEVLERLLEVIEPRQGALPAAPEAEEAANVAPRAVPPAVLADDDDDRGGDDAAADAAADAAENDALTELIRSLEAMNEQWLWQEHMMQEQARQRPQEARLHGEGGGGGRGVRGVGGGGAGGGRGVGGGGGGHGGHIFAGALSIVANVYSCAVLALLVSTVQPTCACVLFFGRVGLFALQRAAALDRRERRGAGEGRGGGDGGGGDEDENDAARPRPRPRGLAFAVTRTDVCKGLFLLAAAGILIQQARKKKREEKDKRKRSPHKNALRASSAFGALQSCTSSGTSISCSYEK